MRTNLCGVIVAAVLLGAAACGGEGDDTATEEDVVDTGSADYTDGYEIGSGFPNIGIFDTYEDVEQHCTEMASYGDNLGPSPAKTNFVAGCADGWWEIWNGEEPRN